MINLAEKMNQLIDISQLPDKISVQSGWQAYYLISNINYENQSDVLPPVFVDRLIKYYEGTDVYLSVGEPVANPEFKFRSINCSIYPLNKQVFDEFCINNNLSYFFIAKLVDEEIYIALTPDEYSIILVPRDNELFNNMGGKNFLYTLNEDIINNSNTDFSNDDWNRFNATFNQHL